MATTLLPTLLAAKSESFMYLGDRFRSDEANFGPLTVGAVAVGLFAIVCLLWFLSRTRDSDREKTIDNPRKLMRELAHAQQLSGAQERLIRRVVRHYRIEPPARVMLEPERFDTAALDSHFAAEKQGILQLKERLFG
jgi:hypothetical protein